MGKVTKAVNTKVLQSAVNDFCKLYNLDITTADAQHDKKAAEEKLIAIIRAETDKYEK